MIVAGVGIGVFPESTARRPLRSMTLVRVELADERRVRERYVLVREGQALAPQARSLVDDLLRWFAAPAPGRAAAVAGGSG
jgi:DNA-binding transcriptional LysR family regulator